MARVTVEDCILNVPNRFELVLLSAKRAREISAGAPITVARDNDKNAVVSLREISENSIDLEALRDRLAKNMRRFDPLQDFKSPEESIQESEADESLLLSEQIEGSLFDEEDDDDNIPLELIDEDE